MVKSKTQFTCQSCASNYTKWMGRCENCGEWNSLVESVVESGSNVVAKSQNGKILDVKTFDKIKIEDEVARMKTGLSDLDTVLGGGVLSGSIVLLAGQPGIGKSTMLMQIASAIAENKKVLYVSGEESASQVKLRVMRLDVAFENLEFVASTSAENISATILSGQYDLVIIDSIQTLSLENISSSPGTVSQITNSSNLIMRSAKKSNTAVIIVGHVTKEGSIAGPKVLEHMVDVVLQFEGDRYGGYKVLRAVKNRYGGTNEVAIFEMEQKGLIPVENISAALLAERNDEDGSVIFANIEGSQAVLVEIQALVNDSNFGYPKRTASGFDINRLNVLIAILEKRTKLRLGDKDVYVNVVGGLKLSDPAADLAVCMAIASAAAQKKLPKDVVVFGEVGLGGEIRSVKSSDKRLAEATKLGFSNAITSANNNKKQKNVNQVRDLRQALIDYIKH